MNPTEANAELKRRQRESVELGLGGIVLFIAGYFVGPTFFIPTLSSVNLPTALFDFLNLVDWSAAVLGILSIGGAIIGIWYFRPRKTVDDWNPKVEVEKERLKGV